jgi:hypothetical protein
MNLFETSLKEINKLALGWVNVPYYRPYELSGMISSLLPIISAGYTFGYPRDSYMVLSPSSYIGALGNGY